MRVVCVLYGFNFSSTISRTTDLNDSKIPINGGGIMSFYQRPVQPIPISGVEITKYGTSVFETTKQAIRLIDSKDLRFVLMAV